MLRDRTLFNHPAGRETRKASSTDYALWADSLLFFVPRDTREFKNDTRTVAFVRGRCVLVSDRGRFASSQNT